VDDFDTRSIDDPNRLDGGNATLGYPSLVWGQGQVTVTATSITWGVGIYHKLNFKDGEEQPINFSAILPSQIPSEYQSKITGLTVQIVDGTPGKTLNVELRNGADKPWEGSEPLTGGAQTITFNDLNVSSDIKTLNWFLGPVTPNDYVVVDHVAFTATTSITDIALAGFVWSYGMLLNNWDPNTGLVRDQARDLKGVHDGIQSTGSLAAATVVAEQLGVIDHTDAVQIVTQISNTLLSEIPRYHGLWPHFVEEISSTGVLTIESGKEWSSIDTAIAAIGLLEAQKALSLDTSGTKRMLRGIDWDDLLTPEGISHGYSYTGTLMSNSENTWNTFGGESWLVGWAYAVATHKIAPLRYKNPPTANGSGFIDEIAWLFVEPPEVDALDVWCGDWDSYRKEAADKQILYYHNSGYCFDQLDLFGLSAAEVPAPEMVTNTYQAFGVGGQHTTDAISGSTLLGAPVAVPHYSAMIASLRPTETITMWTWLINEGPLSPLNNVESLMFPTTTNCTASDMKWNHQKGSWNLALQTLGWGRYLAKKRGQVPILWQAARADVFLDNGYELLAPGLLTLLADPYPMLKESSQLTYTLSITNYTSVTLTATITETLPSHVTPTGVLTWTPTLATPCGTWTVSSIVTVETDYIGLLTNRVQLTSKEGPSDTESVTVCVRYCNYFPIILKEY
jgi:hypothetical protein